jgi:hypothetical protein
MVREVDSHIEETPTEARQGVNVKWQMRAFLLSTAAAAVALMAYFFIYAAPPA